MARNAPTPFIYGRPVRQDEFLNRHSDLSTIFSRVYNCESTVISGEPHIGKSSLLLQLNDETVQGHYLGDEVRRFVFVPLDLLPVEDDYTPATFWEEALEPIKERFGRATIARLAERAATAGYTRRSLERLFNQMGRQERRLVLLLDEFERLLSHPNFKEPSFFALLRSLATRTGGLVILPASRLSVAKMNQRGRELLATGSPLFNNTIEVRLGPFDEETVGLLLNRGAFDLADRRYIRRVAGRHPFLLQAMAAALYETTGEDRQARAAERFYEQIAFHFDDLWGTLNDRTRTTAVILSLLELGGCVLGDKFSYGEIERVDKFGPELRKLAELGLAEQVGTGWSFDWQHKLVWRGERWTVSTQAFAWWVRDVVIAEARQVPTYDDWLHNKRYRFLLTQAQWDGLVSIVRNAPLSAVHGVGALAHALIKALLKGKLT